MNERELRSIGIEDVTELEATMIEQAFNDPVFRATAIVIGILNACESDRQRIRVLNFVSDFFDVRQ